MAELEQSRICKGCWEQMHIPVPIRGVISLPFRAFGVRPSRMNPNTCTICELMFTKVMRARKITIDATIMFADLRGYTSLSQSVVGCRLEPARRILRRMRERDLGAWGDPQQDNR